MTAAQPQCDPLTQYANMDGECCKMCVPGTRMSSASTCLDPQCPECGDNEYQDKYTLNSKCQRQPYCDPNRNFLNPVHKSKKKQSTCLCKEGFHCSSEQCITCVKHTVCTPGHEPQNIGNHTHDTVCQECPKGTFSNDNSLDGACKKWTECENGYRIQESGTDVSDNICEATLRVHGIVIAIVSVIAVVIAIVVCKLCLCKGDAKGKDCLESCRGEEREQLRETRVEITNPTEEVQSLMPEGQSIQEEAGAGTPEENEDTLSQKESTEVVFSENGNYVTQENGKSSILSRQESQTQTFSD
ncbi:tumor necrosis factor receptor superfamily member 5 isoform X1 [Cottoperca gobio]|uniref:Tumor necrosis factor receptor superfamily member 5 isoform X1 n=1 Tax=Cottoperca gobio TaxID=56716 RepID=A0A6J2Q4C1_COTGO|nr:tumor necrosis factor receptor superfamily member 5-like isoform X1 [Cottoperca gobio]